MTDTWRMTMRRYRGGLDIADLAQARYPHEPLGLAISFYESDRREASLGALGHRKRYGVSHTVRRQKEYDDVTKQFRWLLGFIRPFAVDVFPEPELFIPRRLKQTITIRRLPPLDLNYAVTRPAYAVETREGRNLVARQLWEARKVLRDERKKQEGS